MRNPEAGIPWDKIIYAAEHGVSEGRVKGFSGSSLRYSISKSDEILEVGIVDVAKPIFRAHMEADLPGNFFTLNIHTKGDYDNKPVRHPDLRGGEFIDNSLILTQRTLGYTPDTFLGIWCDATGFNDNYRQFMQAYNDGASEAEAAKKTWSGRTVAQHGYTQIEDMNVTIQPDYCEILAQFSKPK